MTNYRLLYLPDRMDSWMTSLLNVFGLMRVKSLVQDHMIKITTWNIGIFLGKRQDLIDTMIRRINNIFLKDTREKFRV